MSLVDRAKNILLSPKAEWEVIDGESSNMASLVVGYALPFLVLGALAGAIGNSVFGVTVPFVGTVKTPWLQSMITAAAGIAVAVVMLYILSMIVNLLAPNFGGEKNDNQAAKLVVYASTAGWVAQIFGIIPAVGGIMSLAGAVYGIYLYYLGLPVLMKNPQDKTIVYMIVVAIVAIVINMVLGGIIVGAIVSAFGFGAMAAGGLGM
ncbi:MAG: YIP1 family protein [Bacteroidetes Order II. Incertae sedis bacterium]|nr:YIP1 family protein [Bacteroidetes Order II. bacterium]